MYRADVNAIVFAPSRHIECFEEHKVNLVFHLMSRSNFDLGMACRISIDAFCWNKHWHSFCVSISIWSKVFDKKCLLTSDDLLKGQWQNIKPWSTTTSVVMILTKSDESEEYRVNILPLTYNVRSRKWWDPRSQTSKIWDLSVVDIGGLITICEFQVPPPFSLV